MRLPELLVLRLVLLVVIIPSTWWCVAARQVDVDSSLILLGMLLEAQLLAQLLHPRLNLLYVASGVIAFAYDDMEMRLAGLFRVSYPLLQDLLRLLYKLPVEVDSVTFNPTKSVVLPENELGSLLVVVVCRCRMLLAQLAHLMCFRAVTALVGVPSFGGEVMMLALLFASQVPKAIILSFSVVAVAMIEGFADMSAVVE